jgi:peptidoglycan/xylan/chitin deacetylase (PgdA/CDA1 family)
VALTYDDGPNGDLTLRLLDVLAERKTPATFFLIGNFVRQQPEIVRRVMEAGHVVGNHTMSHPVLSWQSAARIREELAGCNAVLEDATGAAVRFFRPPHGARRPVVMRIARELGLTPVLWNATGFDWNPIPAEEIAANVASDIGGNRRRGQGSNVLLHDGGQHGLGQPRESTVQATAALIDRMKAREMRFVPVSAWQ